MFTLFSSSSGQMELWESFGTFLQSKDQTKKVFCCLIVLFEKFLDLSLTSSRSWCEVLTRGMIFIICGAVPFLTWNVFVTTHCKFRWLIVWKVSLLNRLWKEELYCLPYTVKSVFKFSFAEYLREFFFIISILKHPYGRAIWELRHEGVQNHFSLLKNY